ncbi:Integrase-type DNA-binding superfamily protein [Perilla frutescens var. hirtella]|uniref:Integrase-type DNA-binding superfamily protein n=1 Tax=Perilla frutescens var. hirtella TaxID=608512 RepID=A0AAD4JLB5_PERFH|nr:Integrase-type DNA-binding superfamily protein [Perilla frutescens var. hirtella]
MAAEDVNKNHDSSLNRILIAPLPPPAAVAPKSGRHPVYRGVRCRSRKWVSEIREPRKTTRIWLGTYATPEMAAAAYDVAALALKGPETPMNFPTVALSYSPPASLSAADIRAAAANAAAAVAPPEMSPSPPPQQNEASSSHEFIDEEALFDMPKLLVDMAEGLLVSPPRISDDDSPENYSTNDSLWSYSLASE